MLLQCTTHSKKKWICFTSRWCQRKA